jgi:SAM-dependent methyltransferase
VSLTDCGTTEKAICRDQEESRGRRRQSYFPQELFRYLASLCPKRNFAWDCGTGDGHLARCLKQYFSLVRASDINPNAIGNTVRRERIEYAVEAAEKTTIETRTVDLVAVAQTLHWLQLEPFYAEVRRVLKPEGIIAVWCYGQCSISPEIDKTLKPFYRALQPYWPEARKLVEQGYRTLPFPFKVISCPAFEVTAWWTLVDLCSYFEGWLATRTYMRRNGQDPMDLIGRRVRDEWGPSQARREIRWPLHLRVGKP